jgi:transcriptional regulator with XRE-family HTH domain
VEQQLLQRFGQRVRHLRQEHGLSQERFADLCTVHYSVIRHFESGRRDVRFTTIARIANAFGVSMSELLKGIEESDAPTSSRGVAATLDRGKLRVEIAALERTVSRLKELESGGETPGPTGKQSRKL